MKAPRRIVDVRSGFDDRPESSTTSASLTDDEGAQLVPPRAELGDVDDRLSFADVADRPLLYAPGSADDLI